MSSLDSLDQGNSEVSALRFQELKSETESLALSADVLIGIGSAALVTGATLYFMGLRSSSISAFNQRPNIKINFDADSTSIAFGGRF